MIAIVIVIVIVNSEVLVMFQCHLLVVIMTVVKGRDFLHVIFLLETREIEIEIGGVAVLVTIEIRTFVITETIGTAGVTTGVEITGTAGVTTGVEDKEDKAGIKVVETGQNMILQATQLIPVPTLVSIKATTTMVITIITIIIIIIIIVIVVMVIVAKEDLEVIKERKVEGGDKIRFESDLNVIIYFTN